MRRSEPRVVRISLPSEFGYEKTAMYAARVVGQRMGFPPERVQDLETAVSEACLNAIEHAHRQRPSIKLVVTIRASHDELQVTVIDHGGGDIPMKTRRPRILEKVEGREESRGWGMYLIESLVDSVRVTVRRAGGKYIRLVMRLESKKHAAMVPDGRGGNAVSHPGKLRIRHVGRVAILDLEGDLTHESEPLLHRALRDPHMATCHVLLNFAAVGYINSAGISILVNVLTEIRPSDRALIVCSLSPHYQKIFRMVGLTSFIRIFETEEAALEWAS